MQFIAANTTQISANSSPVIAHSPGKDLLMQRAPCRQATTPTSHAREQCQRATSRWTALSEPMQGLNPFANYQLLRCVLPCRKSTLQSGYEKPVGAPTDEQCHRPSTSSVGIKGLFLWKFFTPPRRQILPLSFTNSGSSRLTTGAPGNVRVQDTAQPWGGR